MIGIIADNKKDRQDWNDRLTALGLTCRLFDSISDLRAHHGNEPFSGLVVHDWSLMGGSFKEKAMIGGIEEFLPVMRISRKSGTHELIGILGPNRLEGANLWDSFAAQCRKNKPTRLRSDQRRKIFLNATCSAQQEFKVNTFDISLYGCFLMRAEELPMGSIVKLVIHELKDKTPIEAVVRWSLAWGKSLRRPAGFGVEYSKISEAQRQELKRYIEQGAD